MGDPASAADLLPTTEELERAADEVARSGPDIWERIRLRAERRLTVVELHAHRLFDRDLTPEEASTAASAADALAADLGRLGLPSIAQLCRHISKTLGPADHSATTAVHIASTTDDIRTLLSSAIAEHTLGAGSGDTVVALGPASEELDAICWGLASRGYQVVHDERVLPAHGPAPVAAVVSAAQGFSLATRALLRGLAETWAIPTVVLSSATDPATLRKLAQFSTALLAIDTPSEAVISEVTRSVLAQRSQPNAVLCGETRQAAGLLSAHGFDLSLIDDADELPNAIRGPLGLVVFGSDVSAAMALDYARLIRATPSLRRTPIIWLAKPQDQDQIAASRLDMFVVPQLDDALTNRVAGLLRRDAADMASAEVGEGTILTWPAAQVLIDRSLVAAHRSGIHLALATIRLADDLPAVRVERVREALRVEFRRSDVVGARSDRDLVVVLVGVSRRIATNRLVALLDRLDLGDGQSQVGIALFPTDGRSAEELAAAADRARELASQHDGPAVASTTWRPSGERPVDALVVDPDPVLGAMLVSGLAGSGLRSEAVGDGREALARLTFQTAATMPRLLVLDLDSPGLDALSLMRQLRTTGVLPQTNVLLMTARSSEADLRLALDLGVADIIRKPFSATLFLHRVSRVLEDS